MLGACRTLRMACDENVFGSSDVMSSAPATKAATMTRYSHRASQSARRYCSAGARLCCSEAVAGILRFDDRAVGHLTELGERQPVIVRVARVGEAVGDRTAAA